FTEINNSKRGYPTFWTAPLSACCPINSAERQGFEPTTITAYISATSLSKFQIGNETVTIFTHEACPTLTAVCLPNFRVQRYCFLLNFANA
ncbi:hypothetical protein, partial [Coprobacter fastidiosus]|uniref:hypothetical protein n=2 Tax=Bacteroidales TaxID=171549 RepID=UPI0022E4848D